MNLLWLLLAIHVACLAIVIASKAAEKLCLRLNIWLSAALFPVEYYQYDQHKITKQKLEEAFLLAVEWRDPDLAGITAELLNELMQAEEAWQSLRSSI